MAVNPKTYIPYVNISDVMVECLAFPFHQLHFPGPNLGPETSYPVPLSQGPSLRFHFIMPDLLFQLFKK
jgi:hypothetical protein